MSSSAEEYSTIHHMVPRSSKSQQQSPNKEQPSNSSTGVQGYGMRTKSSKEDENHDFEPKSFVQQNKSNNTPSPEQNREGVGNEGYRKSMRGSDEIDAKLSVIRERVMRRLSPARTSDRNESTSTTSSPTRGVHSQSVLLSNNIRGNLANSNSGAIDLQNDLEKQRLRFMVIKLQKEYQNTRIRERRATSLARTYSEIVAKHQNYVNNLKRKYLEKEREIIELKDTIEELNGALQRCQLSTQAQNSTKSLIDKISSNFDTILEAITSKKELLQVIEEQKEELSQSSLIIKKLFTQQSLEE